MALRPDNKSPIKTIRRAELMSVLIHCLQTDREFCVASYPSLLFYKTPQIYDVQMGSSDIIAVVTTEGRGMQRAAPLLLKGVDACSDSCACGRGGSFRAAGS